MAIQMATSRGAHVTAMGRDTAALASMASSRVHTYMADLAQVPEEFLRRAMSGHDAVWHCAGLVADDGSAEALHVANVVIAERAFQAAGKARVPVFVHVSSPALYFGFKALTNIPESYDPGIYATEYARSKVEAEHKLLSLARDFPDTKLVVLRPRALYGPYDRVFMPKLIQYLKSCKGTIYLPEGGAAVLDLCYQGNLAHAMWLASHNKNLASGSIFNITDSGPVRVSEIFNTVAAHLGLELSIRRVPYFVLKAYLSMAGRLGIQDKTAAMRNLHLLSQLTFDTTLSIQRARTYLSYEPLFPVNEAVKLTLKSF